MYVARELSIYRRNEEEVLGAAERGGNSGLMVMRGEWDEAEGRGCLSNGYAKGLFVKPPLPQNAILLNNYNDTPDWCFFLPVLDHPLSSNRYYVILASAGSHTGLATRCSTEEDMSYCCSRRIITDVEPVPYDYRDEYQQYEICSDGKAGFYAKPIVPHSYPPRFLRYKFYLFVRTSKVYDLDEALGIDESLRIRIPELNSTPIIIGKWYTPFVFVKGDGGPLKVKMKKSLFYTLTLEKYWQKIYSWENDGSKGNVVAVDVSIQREVNFLFGIEAMKGNGITNDGYVWFRVVNEHGREVNKVGFSLAIVEKMRWLC
ncbi:hypothetical protein CCACVL1_14339 [Corchorus capsularis]|uniref:Uncharacterized protein n=1 Tax=Corchorus capsularis TaxID=210143 RepID=A0A1R3I7D9_COCAP|nr:hypothetical protein CCACVL1_14339 [Corchorus capsularis]